MIPTWTGARYVLHSSNIVSVVLGGAVIFGLPQALLQPYHSCDAARADVVEMGKLFVFYVFSIGMTLTLYSMFCPSTFKDYADLSTFASWRGGMTADATEAWGKANKERPLRRLIVIACWLISTALFVVFLYSSLQFLSHSPDCILPTPAPS
jgi:hypothetical protein